MFDFRESILQYLNVKTKNDFGFMSCEGLGGDPLGGEGVSREALGSEALTCEALRV